MPGWDLRTQDTCWPESSASTRQVTHARSAADQVAVGQPTGYRPRCGRIWLSARQGGREGHRPRRRIERTSSSRSVGGLSRRTCAACWRPSRPGWKVGLLQRPDPGPGGATRSTALWRLPALGDARQLAVGVEGRHDGVHRASLGGAGMHAPAPSGRPPRFGGTSTRRAAFQDVSSRECGWCSIGLRWGVGQGESSGRWAGSGSRSLRTESLHNLKPGRGPSPSTPPAKRVPNCDGASAGGGQPREPCPGV